jgi:hypothetical protein
MRNRLWWVVLLAILLGIGICVWLDSKPVNAPTLPRASTVSSLEFAAAKGIVRTDDREQIRHLLAVLRQARVTWDHKCGDEGHITLHLGSGKEVKLGILPGHNPDYYEFRLYSVKDGRLSYTIYRVPINAFFGVMSRLGVTDLRRPVK